MQLIAQMIVGNEEKRGYLNQCISDLVKYANKIIILDDGSTDNTSYLLNSFASKYPQIDIYRNETSLFNTDESKLRNQLWEITRKTAKELNDKNTWILSIDADEVFDEQFKQELPNILTSNYEAITTKLCDMWNDTEYRVDGWWSPLLTRLYRFKDVEFGVEGKLHCGCVPTYVRNFANIGIYSHCKLKHLSYIHDSDKTRKFIYYSQRTSGFNLRHALSIKEKPTLKKFHDKFHNPKILIGMLVRDRAWALPKILDGIYNQDYDKKQLSFMFLVNDSIDKSLNIIHEWQEKHKDEYGNIEVQELNFGTKNKEHAFPDITIKNLANMRNQVLNNINDNDYVFLLDSDLEMVKTNTFKHLVSIDKDIVSEVFWAEWGNKDGNKNPNVWIRGGYEINNAFIQQLKYPGIYKVGGLGACTLISKKAINAGVNYNRVENLPSDMRGEDRDYCIRANVLGFDLWADTYCTPNHLEKYNFIEPENIIKKNFKISLSMIVRNEEQYLEKCLESVDGLVDEIVIVDTGSTDKTKEIASMYTGKIYDYKWNDNFADARNFALSKCSYEYILRLDGDECIRENVKEYIIKLINDNKPDVIMFPIINYLEEPKIDIKPKHAISNTARVFKNLPSISYKGRVHEEITHSVEQLAKINTVTVVKSEMAIEHFGYLKNKDVVDNKHSYYAELLKLDIENNPYDYAPYVSLAIHYWHRDMKDKAVETLEKAIQLNPNSYKLLGYLAEYKKHIAYGKIDKELQEINDLVHKANKLIDNDTGKFVNI